MDQKQAGEWKSYDPDHQPRMGQKVRATFAGGDGPLHGVLRGAEVAIPGGVVRVGIELPTGQVVWALQENAEYFDPTADTERPPPPPADAGESHRGAAIARTLAAGHTHNSAINLVEATIECVRAGLEQHMAAERARLPMYVGTFDGSKVQIAPESADIRDALGAKDGEGAIDAASRLAKERDGLRDLIGSIGKGVSFVDVEVRGGDEGLLSLRETLGAHAGEGLFEAAKRLADRAEESRVLRGDLERKNKDVRQLEDIVAQQKGAQYARKILDAGVGENVVAAATRVMGELDKAKADAGLALAELANLRRKMREHGALLVTTSGDPRFLTTLSVRPEVYEFSNLVETYLKQYVPWWAELSDHGKLVSVAEVAKDIGYERLVQLRDGEAAE